MVSRPNSLTKSYARSKRTAAMIEQPDPAILVRNVNPGQGRKRARKTIERRGGESTLPQTSEAINMVAELQDRIETNEVEVVRLREALQRDDEVDIRQASDQLRELQSAFDRAEEICRERSFPVELKLQKAVSGVEGRLRCVKVYAREARERQKFIEVMRDAISRTMAVLHDPTVHQTNESVLDGLTDDSTCVKNDIDNDARALSAEVFAGKQLAKLNDSLMRRVTEVNGEEEKAQRRRATAKQDLDVRCEQKKKMVIDATYLKLLKGMEKLELDLDHMKQFNCILVNDAKRLTDSNRQMVEEIARLNEELIEMGKYLPNDDRNQVGKPGTIRNMLAEAETKRDQLRMQAQISKWKLAIDQKRVQTAEQKIAEMPAVTERTQNQRDVGNQQRDQAETALNRIQHVRSELMSEKVFRLDEQQLLTDRLNSHREKLAQVQKRTQQMELLLKRQVLTREFNTKKHNLRNCNLEHVAQLVSSMLGLHGEIGDDEPRVSASSSASEGFQQ